MKATFKATEDGDAGIELEPDTNDERVLLNIFIAQCSRPGFRVGGMDTYNKSGVVTHTALVPVRDKQSPAADGSEAGRESAASDGIVNEDEDDEDDEELSAAVTPPLPPWLAPVNLITTPNGGGPTILADHGDASLGPAVAGQLYLDRVVDSGLEATPGALRETLSAVMGAIEGAKSYADVEAKLVELAPGAAKRSGDFATLLEGAVMLGIGAGVWAVGEEAP